VTIRWKKTDGTYAYQSLANPAAAVDWTLRSNTFTVPVNTVSMTVFHLLRSVGSLEVDNYKLVQTTTTSTTSTTPSIDTVIPTVSMTSPIAGATVSGASVSITATASDDVGVTGVQFKIDGINLGIEDIASPYSMTWNTQSTSNGVHTITAVARDAKGNTSNVIRSVTVNNTITTPTPVVPATTTTATTTPSKKLVWGAYVGDSSVDISVFENTVGKPVNIRSVFYGLGDSFPMQYTATIGSKGKTLLLFWEPSSGYDSINNGSYDAVIRKFATDAKTYGYPVILSPFHEMNGNWSPWSGTINNNTPAKFITAWRHVYDLFKEVGASNVMFALVYNNYSVPNVVGNQIPDYYPGDAYVDYIGLDGFNFGTPWLSFKSIFDAPLKKIVGYNKPIYIFSTGSVPGTGKAAWITDALGVQVYNYPIVGWVWFNQDGYDGNWLVNSDSASLDAFKKVIPN
jgi:hypothetical protein